MGQYAGDELEAAIAEHEHFGEMFLQTYAEVCFQNFLVGIFFRSASLNTPLQFSEELTH